MVSRTVWLIVTCFLHRLSSSRSRPIKLDLVILIRNFGDKNSRCLVLIHLVLRAFKWKLLQMLAGRDTGFIQIYLEYNLNS